MSRSVLLATLALLFSSAAFADDWSRFRGPNGAGLAPDEGYPAELSAETRLWRREVRPGKSSPVLTADRIFLTGAEDGKLYTQCFDRTTGSLLWEKSLDQPREEIANRLNHEAAISPVTDGENVYAFFKDFGLVAYGPDGDELWRSAMGPFTNLMGLGSSPIVAGSDVIVVIDQYEGSFVAAFDRATGEMRWKTLRTEGVGWATPVLHDGRIVTASRGQLGLHDAATGRRLASRAPIATTIVGSPVLSGDTLYVFGYGGESPPAFTSRLERFDKDGDQRITPEEYGRDPILNHIGRDVGDHDGAVTADEWQVFAEYTLGLNALTALRITDDGAEELWRHEGNFSYVIPSPLAHDGVVYVVRNGGILSTYNASTGEEIGTARLTGAPGGYSASPVAAGNRIWFASEEGNVAVVKAGHDWEVERISEIGESIFATPALSGGVLYLRTDEALYAFGN